MEQHQHQQVILAMYSGGLDSLGMVYKLLTEDEYKDYSLHIHHIHNRNVEHRDRAEGIVVPLVLKELERLGFSFFYSTSEIGSQPYNGKFMYDTDALNFFAGYICSVNPNIVRVAMGMQANDANQSLEERRVRADKILAAFTTDVTKIFPVLNMSKREIYDSLPETLRNMFWSCRRPIYNKKNIAPCLKCDTCVKLREQGIR
jgi:7-cyano-7-deazaguanine synthase in queuosine biosynthesis